MNIQLHKNARTTPAIRLGLQSQPESVSDRELAEAYHLNRHTVAKWRQREGVEDASHRPHDRVCTANRIEHRLTKPRTPQTNGMSERFNSRSAEVLATTPFDSAEHLADTIKRYVKVYNQHIPQKALGHIPHPSGDEILVPKTDPAAQKICL